MAWVLRFIRNCRTPKSRLSGELSFEELEMSKLTFFRNLQHSVYAQEIGTLRNGNLISKKSSLYNLSPFLDNDGLLRVRTRLDFSDLDFDEKCPVIIPKSYLAELIVKFQHLLMKHAGVNLLVSSLRSAYWIIGLRRLAKRVKRFCFSCQRLDSAACSQVVAPLPVDRVRPAVPFAVIGIDHAGPLYCADVPGKKFYILLITCAVVRAVHLELVDSLGVDDCVIAFRKFVSRRGIPNIVYSDNAKTFQSTKSHLMKIYSDLCPEWRFIAPRAPWWGGWWERLVRTTKSALRKSVGTRRLTRRELEAVLLEIEACVNSRPLTVVHDGSATLTPAHFLIGRSHMFEKPDSSESKEGSLIERKVLKDVALNKFWDIWSKNYLRNLPVHGKEKGSDISVGSLVLVRDDAQPRLTWPIAVVTQVFPGRDQIVRSCRVRFKGSEFFRPIQKLHKLEYEESKCPPILPTLPNISSQETDVTSSGDVRVSRFGRKIKSVQKLNL
jgi:transposase InsO family protein